MPELQYMVGVPSGPRVVAQKGFASVRALTVCVEKFALLVTTERPLVELLATEESESFMNGTFADLEAEFFGEKSGAARIAVGTVAGLAVLGPVEVRPASLPLGNGFWDAIRSVIHPRLTELTRLTNSQYFRGSCGLTDLPISSPLGCK